MRRRAGRNRELWAEAKQEEESSHFAFVFKFEFIVHLQTIKFIAVAEGGEANKSSFVLNIF